MTRYELLTPLGWLPIFGNAQRLVDDPCSVRSGQRRWRTPFGLIRSKRVGR